MADFRSKTVKFFTCLIFAINVIKRKYLGNGLQNVHTLGVIFRELTSYRITDYVARYKYVA